MTNKGIFLNWFCNLKSDWLLAPGPFCFWYLCPLILKEFFACNSCFGLFTKIKKGSGTSFWCTFSAWFFHGNVPYLILYQWTKFQCHTFFTSEDIKQNVLLNSYLGIWWRHKVWFIFEKRVKQWLTGRKTEEDGNTKIWISRERKELFRWNKKHFS